jgi:hypothetical protein
MRFFEKISPNLVQNSDLELILKLHYEDVNRIIKHEVDGLSDKVLPMLEKKADKEYFSNQLYEKVSKDLFDKTIRQFRHDEMHLMKESSATLVGYKAAFQIKLQNKV